MFILSGSYIIHLSQYHKNMSLLSCFMARLCSQSVSLSLLHLPLLCLGIPPISVTAHMTWWGTGVMGQWWGGIGVQKGGLNSGSLSPSCYKQGPPVCCLFQWRTEMNSMGGHSAPSQASAHTTPPQSWEGPAICALCLRRGIATPFLFYTPLHNHIHNYMKDSPH